MMNVYFSKKPPIYFITNERTAQTVYKISRPLESLSVLKLKPSPR